MKKFCIILSIVLLLGGLMGCAGDANKEAPGGAVELTVVTSFRESDGNRRNFVDAYKAYEAASGNTIIDVEIMSAVNEEWKAKVVSDFMNGDEPDVLFYFTGADADELIRNEMLVPISEIRREYPDYATNMKESLLPVSTYDGRQYAVSVNGYWEGLFINKKVLESCGIPVPGVDYTWEQFLADCRVIKESGYIPIACALGDIPHYWFEYCVFNNGSVASHTRAPASIDDEVAMSWIAGLNDIKDLYDEGFFPEDTNSISDAETVLMILDERAAFLLDGSWKVGWILDTAENPDDFTVTYVPAKGARKPTDAVGGFSMGYCITRKAWNDPVKRSACVEFVMAMTTDEVVSSFGELTVTALKEGVVPRGDLSSFALSALDMTKGSTAMVPAAQDLINTASRDALFKSIPDIVAGRVTAEAALEKSLWGK